VKGDNKRREADLSDISQGTIDKEKRRKTRMGGKKSINACTFLKILSAVASLFTIFKRCMGQRLQV
jgi:hypothetical protein